MQKQNESEEDRQYRLQIEAAAGDKYQQAYEGFFREFIESAEDRLFHAFKQADPMDEKYLQLLRLQLAAYHSLEAHLKTYVDTGTLAKMEINGAEH